MAAWFSKGGCFYKKGRVYKLGGWLLKAKYGL